MATHIYFDLDGTLTDPFEGITKCILYALDRLSVSAPDDDTLRDCIGPPLQVTFSELVGTERAARALELYRERFDDTGWQENIAYDGIHETLAGIVAAGHRLFVATTKPWIFAKRIVEHFGMAGYFSDVYGSELDGTRIDKTELLGWAIPQSGDADVRIMVGDRKHDMLGARNNGMHAIGVTYGYGSAEELLAHGASRLVHSPSELVGALT